MVKCTNCGAELPSDASFCENCGARVTPTAAAAPPPPAAAAPPPPPTTAPSAYPTPPPPAEEKKGPPMKMIAIGGVVVVIVLAAVLFMASSATSGLEMTYQTGRVTYASSGDMVISLNVDVENPSIFGVEVTSNRLVVRLKSAGMDATFFSGYVSGMTRTMSSGTNSITITVTVPMITWYYSSTMYTVLVYSYVYGYPMDASVSGTLTTKCLLFTGESTVSTGWSSIVYGY